MDPQQQFCLKWNSYSSNLAMTFSNLFKSDILADVTLYCAGKQYKFSDSVYRMYIPEYHYCHLDMQSKS